MATSCFPEQADGFTEARRSLLPSARKQADYRRIIVPRDPESEDVQVAAV